MSIKTEILLNALANRIEARLNQIHDEAIARFRSLAKSTGQRTRVDRMKAK